MSMFLLFLACVVSFLFAGRCLSLAFQMATGRIWFERREGVGFDRRAGKFVLVAGWAVLSGCSALAPAPVVLTRMQVERVSLPPGLLTCAAEPAVGNITLQSQVADYVVRLQEAGADCRDTVASIAKIENGAPAP